MVWSLRMDQMWMLWVVLGTSAELETVDSLRLTLEENGLQVSCGLAPFNYQYCTPGQVLKSLWVLWPH